MGWSLICPRNGKIELFSRHHHADCRSNHQMMQNFSAHRRTPEKVLICTLYLQIRLNTKTYLIFRRALSRRSHGFSLYSIHRLLCLGSTQIAKTAIMNHCLLCASIQWNKQLCVCMEQTSHWYASIARSEWALWYGPKAYLMVSNSLTLESWKVRSLRVELESLTKFGSFFTI